MNSTNLKLVKDIRNNEKFEKIDNPAILSPKITINAGNSGNTNNNEKPTGLRKICSKENILSPRIKEIMRKNESWDNFMKIQWPWIA